MEHLIITKENFESAVIGAEKPVLVDFWAEWCGPCRMLAPLLDELGAEHPEILIGKVNVDEEEDLARRFNVMSIPTVILFKDGKAAETLIGLRPKSAFEEILG